VEALRTVTADIAGAKDKNVNERIQRYLCFSEVLDSNLSDNLPHLGW